jgi:hypothetical protein
VYVFARAALDQLRTIVPASQFPGEAVRPVGLAGGAIKLTVTRIVSVSGFPLLSYTVKRNVYEPSESKLVNVGFSEEALIMPGVDGPDTKLHAKLEIESPGSVSVPLPLPLAELCVGYIMD